MDEKFKITNDTLFTNRKKSYAIFGDRSANVTVNNKNYLLLRQRFHKKINGLKLISGNNEKQFTFSDVRVNDRYTYLLSKSLPVPGGIIIPYSYKREFGFVKIIIE